MVSGTDPVQWLGSTDGLDPVMLPDRFGQNLPVDPFQDEDVNSMIVMVIFKHWKRYLVIPCAALAAASLHPSSGWADSPMRLRADRSNLTDAQKQQLFEARRRWEINTFDQQKALLAARQQCVRSATTVDAFRLCKQEQRQGRRKLYQEARAAMNVERQRLGLPPRSEKGGLRKKGRFNRNGLPLS